jgi:hypothetical protein
MLFLLQAPIVKVKKIIEEQTDKQTDIDLYQKKNE